jgi:hypothetical protein
MIDEMMSSSLPQCPPGSGYTVWLDNFFTTSALLRELRRKGIGAAGTAKTGSGLSQKLIDLRANVTKSEWGALGLLHAVETEPFTINCKEGGPHRQEFGSKAKGCPKAGCKVK